MLSTSPYFELELFLETLIINFFFYTYWIRKKTWWLISFFPYAQIQAQVTNFLILLIFIFSLAPNMSPCI